MNDNEHRRKNTTTNALRAYEIVMNIRNHSMYYTYAFVGALAWALSYLVFCFYKEIIICYIRQYEKFTGKAYQYKLVEYKPMFRNLGIFSVVILCYWGIILGLFREWRYYTICSGFYIFIIGYIGGWSIYYGKYSYKFDYFDEMKWFISYIKENYFGVESSNNSNNSSASTVSDKKKIE